MKTFQIASIPGDGIGPEVVAEGIKILNKAAELDGGFKFDFTSYPWGCEYYLKTGKMMDDDGIARLSQSDGIVLGAVGYPSVPDHISLWGLLIEIRKSFDQYVNLRPSLLLEPSMSPLKNVSKGDIDITFLRENSEGEYSGVGCWLYKDTPQEVVMQNGVFSRRGCERIIRFAYERARAEKRSLTSISKGNAMQYSMVFWDQIFAEIGKEYPDVETRTLLVDAAAMYLVKKPKTFEVVVAPNLFGDILTDLCAGISGGLGVAAGANLNPERKYPSMFEPIHGSAPRMAGKGIADPIATIWACAQMMDFLGMPEWNKKIVHAIELVLNEKTVITPDLGGNASTSQLGDEIAKKLAELVK